MKKVAISLLIGLLISVFANAQIGLINSVVDASKGNSNSKKEKLAKKYLSKEVVNSDTLYLMRVPFDKIQSPAKSYIVKVQDILQTAKGNFSNNKDLEIGDFTAYLNYIKNTDNEWIIDYYQNEYNIYFSYNQDKNAKKKQKEIEAKVIQDSLKMAQHMSEQLKSNIQKAYQDSIKRTERQKKEAMSDSLAMVEKPYLLLERNLRGSADHRYLTVFCGVDQNFANINFSFYLQSVMKLVSVSYNSTDFKVTNKYVPSISTNDDYLLVTYYIKKTSKRPYIKTDDGMCRTITRCEISGTADLVINLFLNYWPQKIKLGGYKQGEIAHFQLMGDYVALYGVSAPNIYKITISEENIHFDYYKTFNIK